MEVKDSETHEVEELKDLIECCICAKNFNEPRLLPCSHTFCLKCLENAGVKSNKVPGNAMACPLCTKEFIIPMDGFSGLQRNLFVDKLMKMSGVINPASACIRCDVCLEGSFLDTENGVSYAEMYCDDCEQNLCQECCKQHSKFRGTKFHKLVDVEEHTKTKACAERTAQALCLLHGRVKLKIFCSDCKKVVCALCFIEAHQAHKGAEVTKVADDFRKQIKEITIELLQMEGELDGKNSQLDQSKSQLFESLENLEKNVMQRFEMPKETGEKQMKLLLLELENLRQKKVNEMDVQKENLDKHAGNLMKHRSYCNDVTTSGSEVDLCQDMNALSEKVTELKAQHDIFMKHEVRPLVTIFQKATFDDNFRQGGTDMIGYFEGDTTILEDTDDESRKITEVAYGGLTSNAESQWCFSKPSLLSGFDAAKNVRKK